jgi:uncharacterized membrane protein
VLKPVNEQRLTSIDMLRGLVIVIMALDHVRDMLTPPQAEMLDFADADALLFLHGGLHTYAPQFLSCWRARVHIYREQRVGP